MPLSRLAILLLATGALPAQTFHVATRVIQVNVIVNDKKGDPVTGLNKDQFTLFDQGKPQRIVFFSESTALPLTPAAPRPPNTFSNRPDEATASSAGVTVVLFDSLNTRTNDTAFARARVLKFLRAIHPDDRIALFALSTNLTLLHDFTTDAAALTASLDDFKPTDSYEARATKYEASQSSNGGIDGAQNDINQRIADAYMETRIRQTAGALETIAHHLAGIAGRKNLVWVSGSFPIDTGYFQKRMAGSSPQKETFREDVEAAARALSNANVAIYPVAAQGIPPLPGFTVGPNQRNPNVVQLQTGTVRPDLTPVADWRSMEILADITGGRVFRETNDIEGSIRHAIDDARATYTIGYYPDHNEWDGAFREIKIKVDHAGIETRYRRGYLAAPEAAPARPALQLADVIAQRVDVSELGLTLQLEPQPGATRRLNAHLRVDPSAMSFEQKDGRWTDTLEVVWIQLGADGKPVTSHGQNLSLRLSPDTYEKAARDGVKMSSLESLDDRTVALRFAARDQGSGAAGSLTIPVRNLFP